MMRYTAINRGQIFYRSILSLIFTALFLLFASAMFNTIYAQSQQNRSGQPNIIYILMDDAGFSDLGPYGSEISTPNIDQLADNGLRYNHFETRAICSPTRAALLTGRNSQSVGMMDLASDGGRYSYARGHITPAAATVAQILQSNGYRTSIVGKWHLSPPSEEYDSSDTRANWPSGKGFQNFYGWLSGWTDQYNPSGRGREIIEGDHPANETNPGGDHVSEAIINHAITYLKQGFKKAPDQPEFLYVAFGASHAPIQVPKRYIDKYEGVYDKGWDKIRKERFDRQKKLGIIPKNTVLTTRNADDPAWEELSADEKTVFTQFMATYAGFLTHADEQIGRLIDYLKDSGKYDNTLIFLMSDNGAAPEAGLKGGFYFPYGDTTSVQTMLANLDDLGTQRSQALYQRPWAWVGGTPFKRYKLWPYAGGVRDPLIVHWPSQIHDKGAIRSQFVEMIDITPTVLDILGIRAPRKVDGVSQMRMHGKSMLQTFADPEAPDPRNTQFFDMRGNRAIYHDGWRAIAVHENGTPFDQDQWELYHIANDFSESENLANEHPEKLKKLKKMWWSEARKYGSLPLKEWHWGY